MSYLHKCSVPLYEKTKLILKIKNNLPKSINCYNNYTIIIRIMESRRKMKSKKNMTFCERISKVAPVRKKITEKRLKWYGDVKRREEGHVLRRMLDAPAPGKKHRGRQKTRRKDACKRDGK